MKPSWMESDRSVLIAMVTVIVLIIIVIGVVCNDYKDRNRFMDECLRDGKKEYECYGIIYGGRRR